MGRLAGRVPRHDILPCFLARCCLCDAPPRLLPAEAVQTIIGREFGRSCMLVHNGVDCQRFQPGPPAGEVLAAPTKVLTSATYKVGGSCWG